MHLVTGLAFLFLAAAPCIAQSPDLTLARDKNWLVIRGAHLPKGEIRINYLEAYCRTGSTTADWHDTTIGHTTELILLSDDAKTMKLRCAVKDGIVVEHTITAGKDDVTFAITAHNPTAQESGAHWVQPCIRLGDFTGYDNKGKDLDDYLPKGFIFLDGKLARMSDIKPWAKEARYIPGQVWCPKDVPRTDVNPRPLSPLVPSNGLIGCFSGDEKMIFGVAFEPYQELFQGVARCVHSDFRIGGLKPGETKKSTGKSTSHRMTCPRCYRVTRRIFRSTRGSDGGDLGGKKALVSDAVAAAFSPTLRAASPGGRLRVPTKSSP